MITLIKIRKANKTDAPLIVEFQIQMALESENLILDRDTVNQGVNAIFSDSEKGQYYVAESEGVVVASLLTTFEWSDWRNKKVIWLQSVYVMPEFRKQGIFRKMYNYILELTNNSENYAGIRLYVDKGNINAINVYRSVGMNDEHYQTFEWMKEG